MRMRRVVQPSDRNRRSPARPPRAPLPASPRSSATKAR
jgi:hypothetical protein